jgi:hypothetical protein
MGIVGSRQAGYWNSSFYFVGSRVQKEQECKEAWEDELQPVYL